MSRRNRYENMTSEDFDRLLVEVIDRENPRPSSLLSVAGVYECLSEEYNNAVLEAWDAEQAESKP